ncbi:hypothetical protein [Muricoccus vinaceus]|uniref:Ig-like domain-containing protein n=1 Tax=Muricoccus vinaceus TaxID=424704 RepID=A0ABV6IYD9_9PROT
MNRLTLASACLGLALALPHGALAQKRDGQPTLAQLFTFDMLDVQVPFLERTLGPAKRVNRMGSGSEREYVVERCTVRARVARDNSVMAYTLVLSPRCTTNLSDIFRQPLPTANVMTAGALLRTGATVTIPCLVSCGNAADPEGAVAWEGGRSNSLVDIVGRITFADSATLAAAGALKDRIQRERGEAYVVDERYNCEPRYREAAAEAFRNLTFTSITVGRGVAAELRAATTRSCAPARR